MFAVSSMVIFTLRVPGWADRPSMSGPRACSGCVEGVRFVFGDRALRAVALISMAIRRARPPVEGVILPVHFDALDQPQQLGITIMATALGGLLELWPIPPGARVGART